MHKALNWQGLIELLKYILYVYEQGQLGVELLVLQ